MLAVIRSSCPATVTGAASAALTVAAISAARWYASSPSVPRSSHSTRNSSPPCRPGRSPGRTVRRSRSARAISRASPTSCPRLSLTVLNRSRSMNSRARCWPVRAALTCAARSSSSTRARLGRPVSMSWWASRSMCRRAARRSVTSSTWRSTCSGRPSTSRTSEVMTSIHTAEPSGRISRRSTGSSRVGSPRSNPASRALAATRSSGCSSSTNRLPDSSSARVHPAIRQNASLASVSTAPSAGSADAISMPIGLSSKVRRSCCSRSASVEVSSTRLVTSWKDTTLPTTVPASNRRHGTDPQPDQAAVAAVHPDRRVPHGRLGAQHGPHRVLVRPERATVLRHHPVPRVGRCPPRQLVHGHAQQHAGRLVGGDDASGRVVHEHAVTHALQHRPVQPSALQQRAVGADPRAGGSAGWSGSSGLSSTCTAVVPSSGVRGDGRGASGPGSARAASSRSPAGLAASRLPSGSYSASGSGRSRVTCRQSARGSVVTKALRGGRHAQRGLDRAAVTLGAAPLLRRQSRASGCAVRGADQVRSGQP